MNYSSNVQVVANSDGALSPADIIRVLRTHVRWWVVPAVVCAVIAALYSLVAPRHWNATQALIVRPEAASVSDERLGKFSDLSEMKTLQETILELAKSQSVVTATLREVGPPSGYRKPAAWPKPIDVEEFREALDMRPPGGAEFGKTEVFYVSVRDTDRDRASVLVAALCDQLEKRMQEVRDQRAQSMMTELEKTVAMADGDLAVQTQKLSSFESKVGADLAELRSLNAQIGAQSEVSQELQAIEGERRANESSHHESVRLLKLLTAAENDSQELLATPSSLLKSQPAVSQLKDALVRAQVYTASLLGSRSEEHPFVIGAREAEASLRDQLYKEVGVAIRGLKVDLELSADREQALANKWIAARERLSRLAEGRAEYANLIASVENHTRLVEAARKNLADARARQAGARSASVISRIDGVEAGLRPVGLGRKTVTAAGGVGGLLLGFGFVFLFAAPQLSTKPSNEAAAVVEPLRTAQRTVRQSCEAHSNFDLFRGMTLEEAIRSAESLKP